MSALTDEQLAERARALYAWEERLTVLRELDRLRTEVRVLSQSDDLRVVAAESERDAYRKAKAENDERFQLAAAEARAELAQANAKLAEATVQRDWLLAEATDDARARYRFALAGAGLCLSEGPDGAKCAAPSGHALKHWAGGTRTITWPNAVPAVPVPADANERCGATDSNGIVTLTCEQRADHIGLHVSGREYWSYFAPPGHIPRVRYTQADDHDQQTGATPAVDMPAGDGAA